MDGDGWAAAAGAGGPTMKEAVAWPRQTAKRLRCGGCERGERGREGGREEGATWTDCLSAYRSFGRHCAGGRAAWAPEAEAAAATAATRTGRNVGEQVRRACDLQTNPGCQNAIVAGWDGLIIRD